MPYWIEAHASELQVSARHDALASLLISSRATTGRSVAVAIGAVSILVLMVTSE